MIIKMNKLVKLTDFYNLRFGTTSADSSGDFIDNIQGKFNIYLATGTDEKETEYYLTFYNSKFFSKKNGELRDFIDDLAKSLINLFPINVGKGLIQSGIERDPDGIIVHCSEYGDSFFETRDNDDVEFYSPCNFVVSSVTYDCQSNIELETGVIHYRNERIENLLNFFGYLDEDEYFALGVNRL